MNRNANVAYAEKNIGRKGQYKINAYAVSGNYKTVNLFISIFDSSEEIKTVTKSDIETAIRWITNFFRKAVEKDYANEVAEDSAIFVFADTLG